MPYQDHQRVRNIVRAASEMTRVPALKQWLFSDERGFWEECVRNLLDLCADRADTLKLTEAQVNKEISDMLVLQGLEALLADAKKRKKTSRKAVK